MCLPALDGSNVQINEVGACKIYVTLLCLALFNQEVNILWCKILYKHVQTESTISALQAQGQIAQPFMKHSNKRAQGASHGLARAFANMIQVPHFLPCFYFPFFSGVGFFSFSSIYFLFQGPHFHEKPR